MPRAGAPIHTTSFKGDFHGALLLSACFGPSLPSLADSSPVAAASSALEAAPASAAVGMLIELKLKQSALLSTELHKLSAALPDVKRGSWF